MLGRRLTDDADGRHRVVCRRNVAIRRDSAGAAYVDAQDEADTWFGSGSCHAQDRAGQLNVTWRLTRGLQAEVLGSAGLPIDRTVRLNGVQRGGEGADGDAGCRHARPIGGVAVPKSHEHALLGGAPRRREPMAVVAFGLLLCCSRRSTSVPCPATPTARPSRRPASNSGSRSAPPHPSPPKRWPFVLSFVGSRTQRSSSPTRFPCWCCERKGASSLETLGPVTRGVRLAKHCPKPVANDETNVTKFRQ